MMQRALAATAAPAKRFAEAPPPPPRPVEVSRPAVSEPAASGFLGRLFGGPEYQSTGQRLIENGRVNYGDPESAPDFFRASRADLAMLAERAGRAEGGGIPEGMMGARPMPSLDLPPMDGPPPMSDMPPLGGMSPASKPTSGTGAGGRDAAINKALEIIHHLVMRGR